MILEGTVQCEPNFSNPNLAIKNALPNIFAPLLLQPIYMFLLSVVVQGLYLSYKRASKRLLGIIVIKLAFLYC